MDLAPSLPHHHSPAFVAYYQELSDFISLFAHFHKAWIDSGRIEPVMSINSQGALVGFDPFANLEPDANPLSLYQDQLVATTISSLRRFIPLNRTKGGRRILDQAQLPEDCLRLQTDLAIEICENIERLSAQECKIDGLLERSTFDIVSAGVKTGGDLIAHLSAVLGKALTSVQSTLMSKIELSKLPELKMGVGFFALASSVPGIEREEFPLLTDDRRGVDLGELNSLGFRGALGCPASLQPTKRVTEFLKAKGFIPQNSMAIFTHLINSDFQKRMVEGFERLDATEQLKLNPHCRAALKGEVRSLIRPKSTSPCPFHQLTVPPKYAHLV